MGGLGGHVDHLYDNPDLTFTDMVKIMIAASSGEIEGAEKMDGQNLFVSYSVKDGVPRAARNLADVKKGGIDAEALAARYNKRGHIKEGFDGAFDAFSAAVAQFSEEDKINIFGPDANIFFNAEVIFPPAANIITYNVKALFIHRDGHAEFDKSTGKVTDRDVSSEAARLEQALKSIAQSEKEDEFKVAVRAVEKLRKLDNDEALNQAQARLNKLISGSGVGMGATVGEYIVSKLDSLIERLFPSLSDETKKLIMERMFGVKGVTATQVYKNIPDMRIKAEVRKFILDQKRVRKEVIYPLEDIIHDFAVAMLEGLKSRFVLSHEDEIKRIASNLQQTIEDIEGEGDETKIEKLKTQLSKLKSYDKISSSMEGFVFAFDGHTYKLTGSFAPVNQIMAMLPNKFNRDAINEQSGEGKVISLFPGKFKPPHSGHFLGAKEMVDEYGADMVFIIISSKEVVRNSGGSKIKITAQTSKKIWEKYIDENGYKGKIIPIISTKPTPIADTFDMLSTLDAGDTVLFSRGEKDAGDRRFKTINSYVERNNLQLNIKQVPGSMSSTGASGTTLGNAIAAGDVSTFKKMVPLSGASAMELWEELLDSVVPTNHEYESNENISRELTFENVVWDMIDEALKIDSTNVPDGQIGGPQSLGDKNSAEPEVDSVQPQGSKGGETTEVEIVTKTVVSVDVSGPNVKVSNSVSEPEESNDEGDGAEIEEEVVTEYAEAAPEGGIINLDYGKRLNRSQLPQIKSTDVAEFVEWMSEQGVDSFSTTVKAADLNPIQLEINLDKVEGMKQVHQSGTKDMGAKPVMVSSDDFLIDGHHRWYALKELGEDINVVLFDAPIDELLSLIKKFPKTTYKGITDEGNIVENAYGKVGKGAPTVVNVGKLKVVVDVDDLDLEPSKHGEERRFRHGRGKSISKDSILQAAERGIGLVIQDYANGEINNNEPFVIRHKANANTPALNVVAVLDMKKGPDTMKIITVMRKDDFKTDNFGGGQQKTYNV